MKYLILPLIFLCASLPTLHAQKLPESRRTSYYTYIFKITDKEAGKIYKRNFSKPDKSLFHTMVDSFPTDSIYHGSLSQGHYLKAFTVGNKLNTSITSVQDFDVMIVKNNTDLVLRIYDLQGNIVHDAKLSIGMKNLHFDKRTNSWLDKKSNKKGLLKVRRNGFTAYYDLNRQFNNSTAKRTYRKIVYGTPLHYVWWPVDYVALLPVDGVKSIIYHHPQGKIYQTIRFFSSSFRKAAYIFDDYYCDNYKFTQKHKGYLVFNKPKYMPGDTVKMKAFIVNRKEKAISKSVDVVLQKYPKNIHLATIQPYRKGAYTYEFCLHDSLDLRLDSNYAILLMKNENKEYISQRFFYEDYELNSLNLKLTPKNQSHYHEQDMIINARGSDENDLNVLDGRLEVLVTPGEIIKYCNKNVFIPDTLTFIKMDLEKEGETEILLSDSIFPEANMNYTVNVSLFTSDNEVVREKVNLKYFSSLQEIVHEMKENSVLISFENNGRKQFRNFRIFGEDNFGNKTLIKEEKSPVAVPLNPYYSSYLVTADSIEKRIDISREPSLISCLSERTADSIKLLVKNPRNIPFSYYVYRKNREKERAYTASLDTGFRSTASQNYYISIQYLWGGRMHNENYQIPYKDKVLKVSVLEPRLVYPSQKSQIELLVTDVSGNPVPGADVTAYGLTKKFDYSPPVVPYLGKMPRSKTIINNFSFNSFRENHTGLNLDYPEWRIIAGLDSIEYYRFIYPGKKIYSSCLSCRTDTIRPLYCILRKAHADSCNLPRFQAGLFQLVTKFPSLFIPDFKRISSPENQNYE